MDRTVPHQQTPGWAGLRVLTASRCTDLVPPARPPGLPDPPEDAEVVGRSGSAVTLSWAAPTSDGGGGLCGYRVEVKAAATGEWQLCHELVPGPECLVDGLVPGETYRFRVAAVGVAGAGEPVYLPQTVRLGELLPWSWFMRVGVQPGDLKASLSWGSLPASLLTRPSCS